MKIVRFDLKRSREVFDASVILLLLALYDATVNKIICRELAALFGGIVVFLRSRKVPLNL